REARAVAGAHPFVTGGGEGIDAGAAHVDRESAEGLAADHDEVAPGLERAQRLQVDAAAVAELHLAYGDRGRLRRAVRGEERGGQRVAFGPHEPHVHAAMDPG